MAVSGTLLCLSVGQRWLAWFVPSACLPLALAVGQVASIIVSITASSIASINLKWTPGRIGTAALVREKTRVMTGEHRKARHPAGVTQPRRTVTHC